MASEKDKNIEKKKGRGNNMKRQRSRKKISKREMRERGDLFTEKSKDQIRKIIESIKTASEQEKVFMERFKLKRR